MNYFFLRVTNGFTVRFILCAIHEIGSPKPDKVAFLMSVALSLVIDTILSPISKEFISSSIKDFSL
jgi:hypothetical protein